jgi:uncharacterized Fe-S cluster-containing radical SAM superfamily protein
MYDPVEQAQQVAAIVCDGLRRKYHRFRPARFYGGIATADCVGCCLGCVFCWSWNQVHHPKQYGRFYSAEEVAHKLVTIARKKGFEQVRISGNEPTICREHLLEVIRHIPPDLEFILETNGILIGHDATYATDLAVFPNLYVRVSLKGACEEDFSLLTGAQPEAFNLQLLALKHLLDAGVAVQPAVMVSFSSDDAITRLRTRLTQIAPRFSEFEVEELVLYGDVAQRLKKANIEYRLAYTPRSIPPAQV